MSFELPSLPYDYGALEPHIDTQTMQLHHDKHHQAYVNNLNAALQGLSQFDGVAIEGTFRAHQVPLSDPRTHPAHLKLLEDWEATMSPCSMSRRAISIFIVSLPFT